MVEFSPSSNDPSFQAVTTYSPFENIDNQTTPTRAENLSNFAKFAVPSAAAGFADTFGTSLGLLDDDTVENYINQTLPSFGDYYSRNKEAAKVVGDLAGMFIPGTIFLKAFRAGSRLNKLISGGRRSRLLSSIFSSGKTYDQLLEGVRARDLFLANRGTIDVLSDPRRKLLAKQAIKTSVADTIKENLAFELGVYATMNDSQVLYPDEMSTINLLTLNAAAPAVFGAAEVAFLRRAIRTSAQNVAEVATAARNPLNLPVGEIVNTPGKRDIGITIDALTASSTRKLADDLAASNTAEREIGVKNFRLAERQANSDVKEQIERLGTDTIIKPLSTRHELTEFEKNTLTEFVKDDEFAMLGAISIEPAPKSIADARALYETQKETVTKLNDQIAVLHKKKHTSRDDAILAGQLTKRRDLIEALEFHIYEPNGTISSPRTRKPLYTDGDRNIKINRATEVEERTFETRIANDAIYGLPQKTIGFTEDGHFLLPGRVKGKQLIAGFPSAESSEPLDLFSELSLYQRSAAYATAQRALETVVDDAGIIHRTGDMARRWAINSTDHYTRLDYITELHGRSRGEIMQHLRLGPEMRNIDDIQWHSLRGKFAEFVKIRRAIDANATPLSLSRRQRITHEDISKLLNLPELADGSLHPLMETFEAFYRQGDIELGTAVKSLEHLKRTIEENLNFPELVAFKNHDIALSGNMMKIPKDRRPVLVLKKPVDAGLRTRDGLWAATLNERTLQMNEMSRADRFGAHLVKRIYDELAGNPTTEVAKRVDTMIEGGQRGRGVVGTQVYAAGENPAILAMKALEDETDRIFRKEVENLFAPHISVFANIKNPRNSIDLESLNTFFHARRHAWDLDADVIRTGDGNIQFNLRNTKANRDRYARLYGVEMPRNAKMPAPTWVRPGTDYLQQRDFAMTPGAYDAYQRLQSLTSVTLANTNHLRRMRGQTPINAKEHYVIPKNFARENVVFLINQAGNLHSVVHGKTLREAQANAQKEITEYSRKVGRGEQKTLFQLDQKDIGRYFDLQDEAFGRMMDFTDPIKQTGKAKGTQVGFVVDSGTEPLNDIIESISKQLESVLRRSRAVYFEPEINYARKLYGASGATAAGARGETIWQNYLASIFGNQTLNPNTMLGKTYGAIESVYDEMINILLDRARTVTRTEGKTQRRAERIFTQFENNLPNHNPFASAEDYAARTFNHPLPANMKKHAARLTEITSLLTLRLLDAGHSILTITSLGATLPGVIKALRRQSGELPDRHAARIGAFGRQIDADNAMFDVVRAVTSTAHSIFQPEFRQAMQRAERMGFLDQSVSETMRTITHPRAGYVENLIRNATDFLSTLSDKSEVLARGISFAVGYNIATRGLGIENERLAFTFAHRMANDTIGNYNPNNKPQIFQGAAGIPLGLFMTFMWNYYQRIFGYIEARDVRALVTQYATQASVFGGQTVPGFQQFNEFFASNYDGTVNPVDGIRNRFGEDSADAILYGSLSTLPKLFGADDGLALYSRGDVTFRNIPTIFTLGDTPVVAMFRDVANATKAAFSMMRERGGISTQQTAEILSNYSTNRFTRSLGYTYTGYVTDRKGQVISADSPTYGEILRGEIGNEIALAARITGLRTLSEARKVEANARVRATEFSQRERLGALRDTIRSDIRAGKFTNETVNRAVSSYIKYGGRPESFPRWLAEQYMRGLVDKSALELIAAIKDPTRGYDVQRLLSALSLAPLDPEFGDVKEAPVNDR